MVSASKAEVGDTFHNGHLDELMRTSLDCIVNYQLETPMLK